MNESFFWKVLPVSDLRIEDRTSLEFLIVKRYVEVGLICMARLIVP